MVLPQTSPNQPQIVRQREHELEVEIFNNRQAPGMREMVEYARVQAATAHANYLKGGYTEDLRQRELVWLSVVNLIENGPKIREGVKNG